MTTYQNWKQLTSIQVGGALCLPVIMIGQTLSQHYGFVSALISIFIGNFLLMLLGIVSANMSFNSRKTTVENAVEYFGQRGVTLFACAMIITMVCWFGIQLNLMTLSVIDLLPIESSRAGIIAVNVLLGAVITGAAFYGIHALNLLSNLSLPMLVGTLGYAMWMKEGGKTMETDVMSLAGISLVVAVSIGVIIDLPTYFRHACSKKDGMMSIIFIFGIALPLIEFVGVYLASQSTESTILDALKTKDGIFWNLWIAIFLILAGWTTNNTNIYSGVMSLHYLLPKTSHMMRTTLFGGLATTLACFDLLNHLEFMLDLLGVMLCSIGAVILTRYLMVQLTNREVSRKDYRSHFIACAFGTLVGFCTVMDWISLTSIGVIDAYISTTLMIVLILIGKKRSSYEPAYSN